MSAPPLPSPPSQYRSISGGSAGTGPSPQRSSSIVSTGSALPPPPNLGTGNASTGNNGSGTYPMRMAQSMTIDEMRHLHRRALQEAEAKRTELRLVLASRYRELVGSSDEVLRMKERAKELHELVHALPDLLKKLDPAKQLQASSSMITEETKDDALAASAAANAAEIQKVRRQLSELTRSVHRALDRNQVHLATTTLMQLFCVIASQTQEYPLANSLAAAHEATISNEPSAKSTVAISDPTLQAQMRMIFFQVQTLPRKIVKSSRDNLLEAASYENPTMGAERSAAALASLDLLSSSSIKDGSSSTSDRASLLLDAYFDSKANLLGSLFNQLTVQAADKAEGILSKIVLILQHDVIVHPYEIFILRKFPGTNATAIMETLPLFDPAAVKMRCTKFLASHLPNIRTKVKSVLVSIAGTTASALGQIRQSLYDKTDGIECQSALNESNPFCTWDDAVSAVVDVPQVLSHSERTTQDRKFSLWSALFSHTFSSLVHSLLTTSFHSVHAKVVSTLRTSLSQAPSLVNLLPHEAYRNTMRIATDLDRALLKVSDDAHELLVHAEEREESERRLRQSLYVQTCEILGRLLCEVRRIVTEAKGRESDGTRELIVGRLCHFLKFRLTSLPTLLDPNSSPVKTTSSGMISYMDLESAFSLADDNEDGLISFAEAMDATESAFSGTQFHGSEMLRGTLLLSNASKTVDGKDAYVDVTLSELMLLTARGLVHGKETYSALGMVQHALDGIITSCFEKWADAALKPSVQRLGDKISEFWRIASTTNDAEWQAYHGSTSEGSETSPIDSISGVSPQTVGFVMNAAFIMNQSTTPADSLMPVPTSEYAIAMGIPQGTVPTLTDTLRWTLLFRSLHFFVNAWKDSLSTAGTGDLNSTAALQLYLDATFMKFCFFERNQHGLGSYSERVEPVVDDLVKKVDGVLSKTCSRSILLSLPMKVKDKHSHVDEVCDLFLSSLFGSRSTSTMVSAAGELDLGGSTTAQPFFYSPLSSTRRFPLLPIQTDRTLADLQIKGAYKKEKEGQDRNKDSSGGSGLTGFFSSMLKKK